MRLLKGHGQALKEVARLLTRHRQLTWELARREIGERYAGQVLGPVWAIGHPLFLMALYVFVFSFVFKVKLGGTLELPRDYTTYLLAGLIPWMSIQEALNKGCVAITGSSQLVKQVVFPIEVLPVKGVLTALFTQLVAIALLVIYAAAANDGLPWTIVLLPIILLLQSLAMLGLGFALAAVGAYFRDLKDIVQLFGIAGMYLVPVFYLPAWVPPLFKPVLYANPFSYLVWCYQDTLYFGRIEHPWAWLVWSVFSVLAFVVGYRLFRRLKVGFGNVL